MTGLSAVVTGAARGIGRAVAERLAADGWVVVGLEREPDHTVDVGCAAWVIGDAAARASHVEAAARARELAPLAAWVNNAGVTRTNPLHAIDEELVRSVVATNGLGYVWGCAAAVSAFLEQGRPGAIVNVGSIHGRASYADHAAYDFTKGGIDALTRNVAVTYGAQRIRANCVAPGAVRTPHLEASLAASPDPAAAAQALASGSPAQRIAEPAEIAAVVAFLLSRDASYISGQSIAVDGGWTAGFATGPIRTGP